MKIEEALLSEFESLAKHIEQGGGVLGVSTGFKDIYGLIHGFRGGDLVVLASRPGVGKTSLALNIAMNAAKQGSSVAFVSLEMPADQIMQRIMCAEARVSLSHLRAGCIQDSDWGVIVEAARVLSDLDFSVEDAPVMTVERIRNAVADTLEKKNPLIVIDSLQLIMPDEDDLAYKNRTVEVDRLVRGLKLFARECDVPLLVTASLSRASVNRNCGSRPLLTDLRESGAIEQTADVVMFVDRSMDEIEAECEDRPDLGLAEIIVAKHRNGPTRDIPLAFNAEYTRFMDFIDDSRAGGYM